MQTGTDAAVVGAGIVGLSTAFALAESGVPVTLYEPGTPGAGQSGGESRIFRHGHDDPRLVELACESRALWRAWEERFGVELLAADGVIALGPAAEERLGLLRRAGVRARGVDGAECRERLPLLGEDAPGGVLDEDAGVLRATAAVAALTAAAAPALVAEEVYSVRPTGRDTVELRTGGRVVEHGRVVVCAGRATPRLAAAVGLSLPVLEATHVRLTFPVRDAAPPRLACLLDGSGAFAPGAYADPLPGNARYAVGLHDIPLRVDGVVPDPAAYAAATEQTAAYVARALPGLAPQPVEARHCWVTSLPWNHDAIACWEAGQVAFLAGNNLFKHAPALGRALAAFGRGAAFPDLFRPEAALGAA